MTNKPIFFDDLKDVLSWIEHNDNESNFGYRILCDINYNPVKWTLEKQIIGKNKSGQKEWVMV